MPLYQIEVRQKQGGRLLAVVEHEAEHAARAATLASEHAFRHPDEFDEEGVPVVVEAADTDMEISELGSVDLYTVEVDHHDGAPAVLEVEAASPSGAEDAARERHSRGDEEPAVKAIAKRSVYPDSIIPVVNQAGPTPL